MKRKGYLRIGALCFSIMMLGTPIQANAICFEWEQMLVSNTYCGTPLCYNGDLTNFTEFTYRRMCSKGLFDFGYEYKIDKVDNGCC